MKRTILAMAFALAFAGTAQVEAKSKINIEPTQQLLDLMIFCTVTWDLTHESFGDGLQSRNDFFTIQKWKTDLM